MTWIVVATFVGGFARYFWHFLAGIVFFSEYAIEAGQAPVIYSLIMNGITYISSAIACSIVLVLVLSKGSRLITSVGRENNNKRAA